MMRNARIALVAGSLGLLAGCENFLDVNNNPNAPETVSANTYLPPMQHQIATGLQLDGRYIGQYTQQWVTSGNTSLNAFDRMGYLAASDAGGEVWRTVYWMLGQNLIDMMAKAEAEERWDVLGVGHVMKAWGWHTAAGLHGEIVIKEAFDVNKSTFSYDSQEFAYDEARRHLNLAIENLRRTDGRVDPVYLARGDRWYNGDRQKWLRFAYGLLAINLNHYSNKASYRPADVIAAVDNSFLSNVDDALHTYTNQSTNNDDVNFLGRSRGNHQAFRQTRFVVDLMNGTHFGGAVDPRMSRMLAPAPDGQYRGLDVNTVSFGALPVSQRPNNFFGYPDLGGLNLPGRYLFDNRAKMPVMTYAQLQFVKAEAALRAGQREVALTAYRNGIGAHIDFVNARNNDAGQTPTQITAAERTAFLASPSVVPTAANLTLSHIMSQKYIAQWAWGHAELWMDMRRYHYTDVDLQAGRQVYPGFAIPTNLFPDNNGNPVYRLRPRYNSEYVWNRPGLEAIGGLDPAYHTKRLWITEP